MIEEKEKIENLDILLKNIEDIGNFNISLTLQKGNGINTENLEDNQIKEFLKLENSVKNFGLTHKYFEKGEWLSYKLTEKGIKAKELGGHLKYQKSNKKTPLNTYQKIYLPFFIIFGLLGIYKVFQPSVSVSEFQKLEQNFDSLKLRFDSIAIKSSKPTLKQLSDTLRTKNYHDLKKN